MNGKEIHVSKATGFEREHVGTEGRRNTVFDQEAFRKILYDKGVIFSMLGSTTYASIMVASGKFIASVFSKPHAWDCAAIKIIIDEAGGRTTDLFGNEQRYDRTIKGFIASNGIVHDELVEILDKIFKK
jgi:myo-inositol-1(or 4)-monophosphatase